MFRVMIFDKNTFSLQGLTDAISDVTGKFDVEYFSDEDSAFEFAMTEQIDLFVIRIYPGRNDNGYAFTQKLRATKEYQITFVILLTSMDDESLFYSLYDEFSCYKILPDPVDTERFKRVLKTLSDYRVVRSDDVDMPFYIDGSRETIRTSEVAWIESSDGQLSFHMDSGEVWSLSIRKYPFDVLETTLSDDFIRIKRTILVNKSYIEDVDIRRSLIKLRGIEEMLSIGVTYVSRVEAELRLDA